ncbi:DNA primase [Streptomyces sp. ICN441]|uniref:bifunctional DNA primase/polymerase n=1 Tax=Streptomyces sp. ICN441 TaxID=2558286 RepID=UPI001068DB89|nr:bifunctional DNA primase/polymerase [Streptomyces sp. ICN441]TFE55071.1 DNA primase [Streptomyces sp. ICN441]
MPHDRKTALLTAALDTAARGWPVLPLRPGGKRPALHGEAACTRTGVCTGGHVKWEQRATTHPDRIRAAWATGAFNLGIATGPAGLVVVDLDKPKGSSDTPCGVTTFTALCERTGQPVPPTRTVRTARGGRHLYFLAPADVRLHNTQESLAPNIDTRAWGGYVVAPGSTTPAGTYMLEDDRPPVLLPEWLRTLLTSRPPSRGLTVAPIAPHSSRCATAALNAETAAVATTTEGGRNARLLAGARAIGRFVAWGDLPRDVVEQAFQGAGESAGLPPAECRATIRSALNWSIRTARPRETA